MINRQLTLAVVLYTSIINAQSVMLECQQTLLFPKQNLSIDTENLNALADLSQKIGDDTYLFTGNVSLNSSQYYLAADEVNINKSSKTAVATGNVKFQNDAFMLTGNKATIKQQAKTTHTSLEQVRFHYPDSKINGKAQKVVSDGSQQVFDLSSYSLCPIGNTDWQIKADKITLNTQANRGVAEDVTLEFFGIPFIYLPKYVWVLKGRASGFLAPSIASYRELSPNQGSGYRVKIPYYFNLAPDRDFLLTLNQLSTRGSALEGVYRQLLVDTNATPSGKFEVKAQYLNEDDITNEKRWLLDSTLNLAINKKIRLSAAVNRVSDADYFQDITRGNTSKSSLFSQIDLEFLDPEQQLKLAFFAENEQTVNNGIASYTIAPEITISKGLTGLGGRAIDLSFTNTQFAHQDSNNITGGRSHIEAAFKRSITTNAYALTPKIKFSSTDYALDNTANQRRDIASFSLDYKRFFERETQIFGNHLIQTLTPKLSYHYTQKKDQSNLPNFDSEIKSNLYEALFSGQKFIGIDRISNANDLTLGLESDFYNAKTGDTYLNLKVAQAFYKDDQALDIDGNLVSRREYSDIAASANLSLADFTFHNQLQYDPENGKINQHDTRVQYSLSPKKFLALAHHNNNDAKSVEVYGAYPINAKTHAFAGVNRATTDSITNKETAGIVYQSCCWAVRLAYFKEHLGNNNYEHVTNFELVLNGLASSDSSLAKRIQENIPNYLTNLN